MAESHSVFGHLDRTVNHICSIVYCLLISQIGAAWIITTCSIVSYDQRTPCFGKISFLVSKASCMNTETRWREIGDESINRELAVVHKLEILSRGIKAIVEAGAHIIGKSRSIDF